MGKYFLVDESREWTLGEVAGLKVLMIRGLKGRWKEKTCQSSLYGMNFWSVMEDWSEIEYFQLLVVC